MGMDVYGKKPKSEAGKYFRNNVWWWRPLAEYCLTIAPDISSHCEHWGSNDGDGLNAKQSVDLANALEAEVKTGQAEAWAVIRQAELDAMPDERCELCHGTGSRTDEVAVANGFLVKVCEGDDHPRKEQAGWCNGCDGKGRKRPWESHYPFSVENVQEWIAFLRDCGGFEIC